MSLFDNMTPEAMTAWESLTKLYPNLNVSSAYRSPAHNKAVGGAKRSQHMRGNAFDVPVSHMSREDRLKLIRDALNVNFKGIGIYDNSLHFDVGPERRWGPDYTRNSVPDWALPAFGPVGVQGGAPRPANLSNESAQDNYVPADAMNSNEEASLLDRLFGIKSEEDRDKVVEKYQLLASLSPEDDPPLQPVAMRPPQNALTKYDRPRPEASALLQFLMNMQR